MVDNYTYYPITPMGAPRMTRADAWRGREVVLRYRAFKDECRMRNVNIPENPSITFYMPMPESWSMKKKTSMDGTPHKTKSDLDNLLKALFDAVYKDDAHIWRVTAKKIWSFKGGIKIEDMQS